MAYLCASEREWETRYGHKFKRWEAGAAMDWLHREDGPALTLLDEQGRVWEEYWFLHGRNHRVGGPQRTIYDRDGSLISERWMEDDILVRQVEHKSIHDVIAARVHTQG